MTIRTRRASHVCGDAQNTIRRAVFFVVFVVVFGTTIAAALADVDAITVEQLMNEITERRSRITSMQGSYTSTVVADAAATAANKMIGLVQNANVTFAWSGRKRLLNETSDAVSADMSIIHSVAANVYDGTEFRRRKGKLFQIQTAKSSAADGNQFLNALFWPMTDDEIGQCSKRPSETRFLPCCFRADGWTTGRVALNGLDCIIAEKHAVGWRYWFVPSFGYCLAGAEFDKPSPRIKHLSFACTRFTRVAEGVFFPMEISIKKDTEDKQGNPTGTLTARITINDLGVNNVRDSVFVLKPKDGDYVIDSVRHQTYDFVEVDDNTLDTAAQRAVAERSVPRQPGVLGRHYAIIATAAGIAVGLIIAILRLRSRPTGP